MRKGTDVDAATAGDDGFAPLAARLLNPAARAARRLGRLRPFVLLLVTLPAAVVVEFVSSRHAHIAIALVLGLTGVLLLAAGAADAVAILTAYLVAVFALPAVMVIHVLGAIGTPANLIGLIGLVWWGAALINPRLGRSTGPQPARFIIGVFLALAMISYAHGFTRTLSGVEARNSDRSLIGLFAVIGGAMLAVDGITSLDRLVRLLKRVVLAGTFLALVGMFEFVTHFDMMRVYKELPFITPNDPTFSTLGMVRGGFTRVSGTAGHPIEFGVVLAMIFPLALHFALVEQDKGRRRWRWAGVVLIPMAALTSVSRSAILGLAVALAITAVGWTWRQRASALAGIAAMAGLIQVSIPGLLGTLTFYVTHASQDSSINHRTNDYKLVGALITHSIWIGRGFGTFIPQQYFFLDNQYLGTLIEMGIIGLVALIAVFVVWYMTARGARRRSSDPTTRNLAQALAAAALVGMATYFTFDAAGYRMISSLTFLLLGCTGALWRITRAERLERAALVGRHAS